MLQDLANDGGFVAVKQTAEDWGIETQREDVKTCCNDNDNDKRLGLTAKADQPDHKKYNTPKIKMDNEAVQKLQTS